MAELIRLVRPGVDDSDLQEDVARLRAALNVLGFDASPADISDAYGDWCDDYYAANWMSLGSDDELVLTMQSLINGLYLVPE